MLKSIISNTAPAPPPSGPWLPLEQIARAELTSEAEGFPLEAALAGLAPGWRAASEGPQRIRFIFQEPQTIRTISLAVREESVSRTQEFVLRWACTEDAPLREILRQQYHFSPPGTVLQEEKYTVDLPGARILEIEIVPEISGGGLASLADFRVSAA